jgi:hypothetical protein
MTDQPLSAAAQAVINSTAEQVLTDRRIKMEHIAAAALRAAADQVAPSDAMEPRNNLPMAVECQRIRAELLAIAAELDNTPQPS